MTDSEQYRVEIITLHTNIYSYRNIFPAIAFSLLVQPSCQDIYTKETLTFDEMMCQFIVHMVLSILPSILAGTLIVCRRDDDIGMARIKIHDASIMLGFHSSMFAVAGLVANCIVAHNSKASQAIQMCLATMLINAFYKLQEPYESKMVQAVQARFTDDIRRP